MEIDDGIKLGGTFSELYSFNYPHYNAKNQKMYQDIKFKPNDPLRVVVPFIFA